MSQTPPIPEDRPLWTSPVEAVDDVSNASDAQTSAPLSSEVASQQPAVSWREPLALSALVALCDIAIYRGRGYAGLAALFMLAPALLRIGSPSPKPNRWAWALWLMLGLLAAKAVWCGSVLLACVGFALLAAFAVALSGHRPFVLETLAYGAHTVHSGGAGLVHYLRSAGDWVPAQNRWRLLNVALPAFAMAVFGMIFVMANPDLVTSVSRGLDLALREAQDWLRRFSLLEVLFWLGVFWCSLGLLRPTMSRRWFASPAEAPAEKSGPAPLYAPFRNTLAAVIALFGVYLVFEFSTLWFREFPEGFYYSGYAHEGAAWLTLALALATALLSLIFRGAVMSDPRLGGLRQLAWIWSIENFLLAAAVYNRLFIYIGFNGMSRMRMVGLFGITAVAIGFGVVLWKIAHNRSFLWLVRRQLWALGLIVFLFVLTPVDAIVVSYNVRRILAGDPAPAVQISVHPIDAQGAPLLRPLVHCDNAVIREGVKAMLANRLERAETLAQRRRGWTAYQLADQWMLGSLKSDADQWSSYEDEDRREEALSRFHDYAYQWY